MSDAWFPSPVFIFFIGEFWETVVVSASSTIPWGFFEYAVLYLYYAVGWEFLWLNEDSFGFVVVILRGDIMVL
jgi:hypothetical protein